MIRERVDVHTAGTPCKDHSVLNRTQGPKGPDGPHQLVYYVWIRLMRDAQPRVIVHENVHRMGTETLKEDLGDLYFIGPWSLCQSLFGWPAVRDRQYCPCPHLEDAVTPLLICPSRTHHEMLALLLATNVRKCDMSYTSFADATPEEQEAEKKWSLTRKAIKERRARIVNGTDNWCDGLDTFHAHMSPNERARVDSYMEMNPDGLGDLGQEATTWPVMTRGTQLHCLHGSTHMLYGRIIGERWLVPEEVCQPMGWAMRDDQWAATGYINNPFRSRAFMAQAHRKSLLEGLGNAMHVHVVGSVLEQVILWYDLGVRRPATFNPLCRQPLPSSEGDHGDHGEAEDDWASRFDRVRALCRRSVRPRLRA